MMVIRECVKRHNRLPQIIVTDGGSDFRSTYYEALLAYYSVTKKQRPAHKARFGSVIERMFGTTISEIIHNLKGNTKSMKDPRNVSNSFNPVKHAVWTLERLDELLNGYFYDYYDQREHSTLNESPREAFERSIKTSGSRPLRYIPYDNDFYIMTLPIAKGNNGNVKIDPQQGVKIGYINYHCSQFSQPSLNGAYVQARYDPFNMGIVYCYIKGQWVKCFSDYYKVFENRTEKQIMIASEEIKDKKKKYAANAGVRAKELAQFLQQAEKAENELLLQQKRDNENPSLRVLNGRQEDIVEKQAQRPRDADFNSKLDFSIDEAD
jgi:hypothetical protein